MGRGLVFSRASWGPVSHDDGAILSGLDLASGVQGVHCTLGSGPSCLCQINHCDWNTAEFDVLFRLHPRESQMPERLGNRAINKKVAGSIPGRDK